MMGKERRLRMNDAIKTITIPFLRAQGFKGSFPHFRRMKDDRINLLTFQFSLSSPKFVVEISNCSPKGIARSWGNPVKPSNCTAHDMHRRLRLGNSRNEGDHWFDFSKDVLWGNIYQQKAKEIIELWQQAEVWWAEDPHDQRNAMVPQ
ncbi:DUF4304 domain-containing protein [Mucilaginibacter sp. FT3.2]|uniref:DUF4304 domain-containing protein n=1 Tax=Mucilaginibacter sp. FT3.2 TaxID=2723090 RepID=UPI001614D571|nr:DUF4304 domain-containing protein [Mucilaginibacter sp. FT3.2]MBB6233590.1 hypothetical protein [Mucilaginibacter sp. FT3.2]